MKHGNCSITSSALATAGARVYVILVPLRRRVLSLVVSVLQEKVSIESRHQVECARSWRRAWNQDPQKVSQLLSPSFFAYGSDTLFLLWRCRYSGCRMFYSSAVQVRSPLLCLCVHLTECRWRHFASALVTPFLFVLWTGIYPNCFVL